MTGRAWCPAAFHGRSRFNTHRTLVGRFVSKNVFEVFFKLLKPSSFQKSGSFRTKPKPKIRQLLKFIAGTKFFSDCRVSSFRDADQVDFAFFLLKAL